MKLSMAKPSLFLAPSANTAPNFKHWMPSVMPAVWLLLLFLSLLPSASAQTDAELFPSKPEPAVYVHDYSSWLTPHERSTLEDKLRRYWDSTSTQIVVMIRPDIGDYDKNSYATELGERWGIGQAGKDNGVVILVKTEQPQRGAYIATGYGAEGALPDGLAGEIVRTLMIPAFKEGNYFIGLDKGTTAVAKALSGEYQREQPGKGIPAWIIFLLIFAFFLTLFFMMYKASTAREYTHNGKRVRRPVDDADWAGGRNNRGGGWIIGGGGWSSGSGGGGFGGGSFGGGGFGGGGAGGDW
jgi:uncharacterized protein